MNAANIPRDNLGRVIGENIVGFKKSSQFVSTHNDRSKSLRASSTSNPTNGPSRGKSFKQLSRKNYGSELILPRGSDSFYTAMFLSHRTFSSLRYRKPPIKILPVAIIFLIFKLGIAGGASRTSPSDQLEMYEDYEDWGEPDAYRDRSSKYGAFDKGSVFEQG